MLGDDKRGLAPHQPRQASPCPGASLTRDMLRFPTQWVCTLVSYEYLRKAQSTQPGVSTCWIDDAGTGHAAIWQSGFNSDDMPIPAKLWKLVSPLGKAAVIFQSRIFGRLQREGHNAKNSSGIPTAGPDSSTAPASDLPSTDRCH